MPDQQNDMSGIQYTAQLSSVVIKTWGGRKTAKGQSETIAQVTGGKAKAFGVTKAIIDDKYLKPVRDVYGAAMNAWKKDALDWAPGIKLMPAVKIEAFSDVMPMYQNDFDTTVENFLDHYDTAVEQAMEDIGTEFSRNDYPSVDALRRKFSFTWGVYPVPDFGDIRVEVSSEVADQLRAQGKRMEREAIETATADVVDRMQKLLERCLTAFGPGNGERKARIDGSLIEALEDASWSLDDLNVMNNPTLASNIAEFRSAFQGIDPEAIKENDFVREITHKATSDLAAKMGMVI